MSPPTNATFPREERASRLRWLPPVPRDPEGTSVADESGGGGFENTRKSETAGGVRLPDFRPMFTRLA